MSGFIVAAVIIVFIIFLVSIFNRLVALKNRFQNAFSQIDVQLKRRYDLIPNLVETAKSYMAHEKDTLEAVIAARNGAASSLQSSDTTSDSGLKALGKAEGALQSAMSRFSVVMEQYPELKADGTMMQLSEELSSTENKVAFSRQAYNDSVMDYNTCRQSFPQNILANFFGHTKNAQLLEFEDRAEIQAAPKVSF